MAPTASPRQQADPGSTKERILDIALDLFVEKGYDKTSLREIAEPMGFTKAALYYHFASKEEILLGLHMRLHEVGHDALRRLDAVPATTEAWAGLLQELVDGILAQRQLLLLHERNHAAIEALGKNHDHGQANDDIQAHLSRYLADATIAPIDRVRLAGAMGTLFAGLVLAGSAFSNIPIDELGALLRQVIGDTLEPGR